MAKRDDIVRHHQCRRYTLLTFLYCLGALVGCSAVEPLGTSQTLGMRDARTALSEMKRSPRPLERPVIVLGGYSDPGILTADVKSNLQRVFHDEDRIISVPFMTCDDFDACRTRVVERVEQAFPSDDPEWTSEVDVVAISMGGLVARYAARARDDDGKRLRVARLFTIATPHRGAAMADLPTLDRKQIAMRAGSPFMSELNGDSDSLSMEIRAYAREGDLVVGVENSSPPGADAIVVSNPPFDLAHILAACDPRILADICRRLRDDDAILTESTPAAAEVRATASDS